MVKTSCDWCMDVSEDEAMRRRTAVRIFFVELAETSSRLDTYVFDWIKERTVIAAREDCTRCIAGLLIELLWGKVVDLSQLLNFIMAEGIVEHKDSGASQRSLAAFREYMSQIVRNNDERESKLDDSMVRTLKQLLESANEMSDATTSRALTPPSLYGRMCQRILKSLQTRKSDCLNCFTRSPTLICFPSSRN